MPADPSPTQSSRRPGGARVCAAGGVIALALGIVLGHTVGSRRPDVSAHQARATQAAQAVGLEPALLLALIAAESGGDPQARSRAKALGLCQLRLATAQEEARRRGWPVPEAGDLLDPDVNVRLGAAYLARQKARFHGDEALALAAYNAGPTRARRWGRRSAAFAGRDVVRREGFRETRHYVDRVLRWRDDLAGR